MMRGMTNEILTFVMVYEIFYVIIKEGRDTEAQSLCNKSVSKIAVNKGCLAVPDIYS